MKQQEKVDIMYLNPAKIISKGHQIIKKNKDNHFEIYFLLDFSQDDRNETLLSTVRVENALLFQMKKILAEKNMTDEPITNHLVYLDFSGLFKSDSTDMKEFEKSVNGGMTKDEVNSKTGESELLFFLFRNGFDIKFSEKIIRHFVPFDGSGSMFRNSKISFIDEELEGPMNERILLGLDFIGNEKVKVIPNKYFAYRGLYLTDGTRIETVVKTKDESETEEEKNNTLVLSAKTVVVIKDDHAYTPKLSVMTANYNDEKDLWNYTGPTSGKRIQTTPFDGEGILCPEYARKISLQLLNDQDPATSFQVRMPFVKGVLHSVDFHLFFEKEIGKDPEDSEKWTIIDYFGVERDLRQAKIILTKSMLKNAGWLKDYVKDTEYAEDPMELYFTKMKEYQHTLYIKLTNKNFHNEKKEINLDSQLLNTLDMDREQFRKKLDGTIDKIKMMEKDPNKLREFVLGKPEVIDCAWKYALSRNILFLTEDTVKEYAKKQIDSKLNGIYEGRIPVKGENRYLSGDLLAFLLFIQKSCFKLGIKDGEEKRKELEKYTIKEYQFRMPAPNIVLKNGNRYALHRSPMLSRNEHCVLQCIGGRECKERIKSETENAADRIYEEYFNSLSGVVMVARCSFAPITLGGADFDGDMIRIIDDDVIVNAMKNNGEKINDKRTGFCKAVVKIPSRPVKAVTVPPRVQYFDVKDTFGNQIGEISNLALRLGEIVYSDAYTIHESDTEEELKRKKKYLSLPAKCTILTGLEIDATKSGKHPKKNIRLMKDQLNELNKKRIRMDYIEKKELLDEFNPEQVLKTKTKNINWINKTRDKSLSETICSLRNNIRKISKNPEKNEMVFGKMKGKSYKKAEKPYKNYNEERRRQAIHIKNFYTIKFRKDGEKRRVLTIPIDKNNDANIEMLSAKYLEAMFHERPKKKDFLECFQKWFGFKNAELFIFDSSDSDFIDREIGVKVYAMSKVYSFYVSRYRYVVKYLSEQENFKNWINLSNIIIDKQYYDDVKSNELKKNEYLHLLSLLENGLINSTQINNDENDDDYEYNTTNGSILNAVKELEDRIKKENWIYTEESKRMEVLKVILSDNSGFSDFIREEEKNKLITNFSYNGFLLLYCMTKDIEQRYISLIEEENIMEPLDASTVLSEDNKKYEQVAKKYEKITHSNLDDKKTEYDKMIQIATERFKERYQKALDNKYTLTRFQGMLISEIDEIIQDDKKNQKRYWYYLYQFSPKLFWQYFEGERLQELKDSGCICEFKPYEVIEYSDKKEK